MFRYEHPEHLWLLAAVPLLLLLVAAYWYWRKKAVTRLGDVERVMPALSGRKFWLKNALLAVGLILLAIAWANPQLGARKQTVTQEASDIFIALDISNSMLCQDIAPSRLELAKVFAQKLVQSLEGERIGLIFFAGNAYLQMPLSTDYSFILQSIQTAAPDLITEQGTAIPAAIELAGESFGYEPGGGRAVIVITDGESHDDNAVKAADKAYDAGIVVFAVGAGTLGGGPIPTGDYGENQYKRDEKGEIVRTHLDEALLSKLALAGGGQAFNISQGDAVISALRREVDGLQKRELEIRSYAEFESWYQWFLLPALLLFLLEALVSWKRKRSGGLTALLALAFFAAAQPLSAQSTHKLLRQGDEAYDLERYKEAEKHYRDAADKNFNDPVSQYNLGNALYEQGNWPDAATRFGQAARSATNPGLKADALHNLGNAQLKQNKFKEAVEAYENSLRLRPGDAGAKQNLQMAKKKLKEQQQQEQQQKQQQQQQEQEQQQQDAQNQQNNQPDQQQQQQQEQPQQPQDQPQQQQQQQQQQKQLKQEEARRLLETAIGPEDQKNARKYREQRRQPHPSGREKDW